MQGESGMTIMRYAILIALAIASLCAMVSAGADNGQRFLVDAGAGRSGRVTRGLPVDARRHRGRHHSLALPLRGVRHPDAARRLVREQQAVARHAPDPGPDVGSVLSDEGESFRDGGALAGTFGR